MDETKTYLGLDVNTSKIILKDIIKRNIRYEYNFPLSTYEFQMPGRGERITIKMALSNVEIYQMRQLNMNVDEFVAERILEQIVKYYTKW